MCGLHFRARNLKFRRLTLHLPRELIEYRTVVALSPLQKNQFDTYKAAHLLWRAGFGGTWDEAEALAQMGIDRAVDTLLNFAQTPVPMPEVASLPAEDERAFQERIRKLPEPGRQQARQERRERENNGINELKFWWLNRMLESGLAPGDNPKPAPLQEKLTLFWHSHFASSFADKIEHTYPMWQQNEMFREHALDPFPELLKQLIRNPAMLAWLDNAQSRKEHANENLGRELMELFSMGPGHYSENDVKAAARSLTGYSVHREDWSFRFKQDAHDTSQKTYFGETGNWDGDDVVRLICAQEATSRFMTRKFLEYFVYEGPEPELLDEASAFYRSNGYALKPFLGALFKSELFYSPRATNSIVKSPVVLTIGALKTMRVKMPEKHVLTDALRLMGQDLFFPPEVNGWLGGMAWINSNMLLIRYNFANYLLNGVSPDEFKVFNKKNTAGNMRRQFIEGQRNPNEIAWSPRQQLRDSGADRKLVTSGDIVDYYVREFLQRPVPRELRDQLQAFAETDAAGGHRSFSLQDSNFDERAKGLIHLIMSSPDYQLC